MQLYYIFIKYWSCSTSQPFVCLIYSTSHLFHVSSIPHLICSVSLLFHDSTVLYLRYFVSQNLSHSRFSDILLCYESSFRIGHQKNYEKRFLRKYDIYRESSRSCIFVVVDKIRYIIIVIY